MEDLLANASETLEEIAACHRKLVLVFRSLSKPQRQKWVSLMVKLLMYRQYRKDGLIWRLKMLWLADDDPRRTYAESAEQLQTFAKPASADVRQEL